MVTRSRIASLAATQSGPQLLMEVTDFTGLGDILAAGSVVLGGKTWTVLNAANGVKLESNGALLDMQGKAENTPAAWFNTSRSALALYCDVTTLDPAATDLDSYEIQLVRDSWPALGNWERLDAGFYEPGSLAIGTNGTIGTAWDGSKDVLGLMRGGGSLYNPAAVGDEVDTRTIMGPAGIGVGRAQATPSADPSDGTITHAWTFGNAIETGAPITRLCKPTNARAVVVVVGKQATSGIVWQISAIRVWKFPGA